MTPWWLNLISFWLGIIFAGAVLALMDGCRVPTPRADKERDR